MSDQRGRTITSLMEEVYANAQDKGFWDAERNPAESIALMHSELSEALEALRRGNPPSDKIPGFSGVEEELADVVIRILDWCGGQKLDLEGALLAKMKFNAGRPHKHGKAF